MKLPLSVFIPALLSFLSALASSAQAADAVSNFSGDVYSQSLWRLENRLDRSRGFFHETRVRGSYDLFSSCDILKMSPGVLKLDVGSYFLGEWATSFTDQALPQNLAVSPYFGARIGEQISGGSWILSGSAIFEGRLREPIGETASASGAKGWDPRTSAVVGFWWMNTDAASVKMFADIYGDLVYAPKFSNALMSTVILRGGARHAYQEVFVDGYAEYFSQNTPSLELGTKRSEARLGLALGHELRGGSVQLRVWHGFPLEAMQIPILDPRSRTEALLLTGFTL